MFASPSSFLVPTPVALSVALVIDQSLPRDTMKKVNDSLAALQGGFTASDEISVFTYGDGVNNVTDFTAALGSSLAGGIGGLQEAGRIRRCADQQRAVLRRTAHINGLSVDPNLDTQRGNSGVGVVPKEIHTSERCHSGCR